MSTLNEAFKELNNLGKKSLNESKEIIVKTKDGKTTVIDKDWLDYKIEGYTFVKEILEGSITDDKCRDYYFVEYNFDENPPADEIEKLICKALRSRLKLDESVSKRDDIDADRDNKVERAKKTFGRIRDDADADKDYKLKKDNLEESSKRDDIDADADDKKEKAEDELEKKIDDIDADKDEKKDTAKKDFEKAEDDADADRDEKLKKEDLKESDKPAAISIEDAQKWVDYDMEKYGRISMRTNRLVRRAGYQIVKDDHGDYEVIVGHYE